jgi:hypothetical protein
MGATGSGNKQLSRFLTDALAHFVKAGRDSGATNSSHTASQCCSRYPAAGRRSGQPSCWSTVGAVLRSTKSKICQMTLTFESTALSVLAVYSVSVHNMCVIFKVARSLGNVCTRTQSSTPLLVLTYKLPMCGLKTNERSKAIAHPEISSSFPLENHHTFRRSQQHTE